MMKGSIIEASVPNYLRAQDLIVWIKRSSFGVAETDRQWHAHRTE